MRLEPFFDNFDILADTANAVEKMRALVLDLAATGRLVPHESEWPKHSLKSLAAKIGSGATPAGGRDSYFSEGVPLIRSMNVHFRGFDPVGLVFLSDEQARQLSNVVVQPNDVLLNITGASIGRVTTAPSTMAGARVNQHVTIIRPKSELFPRFLAVFLASPLVQRMIDDIQVGATRQALTKAMIEQFEIPLPPPDEQKRIVAKVDELMDLCDRLEAQQKERKTRHAALTRASLTRFADAPTPANLNFLFQKSYTIPPADLRKSILTLAVQGKLVPQDASDEPASLLVARLAREMSDTTRTRQAAPLPEPLGDSQQYQIPDSWRWCRFRDVAIIASNLVNPKDYPDFTHLAPDNIVKGNGVLLACSTVREDKVISSNHRFYRGQIVYSKIRPNLAKAVVVHFDGLCSADMYPIEALIDVNYLHRYMLSEPFLIQAVKTDTRVAMPKINQTELNATLVPVPPLLEQRRIVDRVDELMTLVDTLEAHLVKGGTKGAELMEAVVAELTIKD
ncbi:MAG TPA: restriction endonuclease subunit S [Thermoanaerobaculia bacterium]|nr:restriction endonuclease subunit S [Thermoanaerobaculia bacterium]